MADTARIDQAARASKVPRAGATALAIAVALGGAWLSVELARRDADLGPPLGADRLIRAIDAAAPGTDGPGPRADASGPAPLTAADVAMAARQALRERPNDGRAYRVLAQAADAQGDTEQATRLYNIAVRLAPRDRLARAALIDRAFAQGDVPTALEHVDALLRVAPNTRQPLLSALAAMLDRADVRSALVARLQAVPNWRGALMPALLADATPPADAEALLSALARADHLTPGELNAHVTLLQRLGHPDRARAVWLAALPPAQRALASPTLFDGGFEDPDVTGGFAWQMTPHTGVSLLPDDSDPAEGARHLSLVFEGRAVSQLGLAQPLALPPGQYRLTGQGANDTNAARPFVFEVACTPQGPVLASTELPSPAAGRGWQPFGGTVTVPAEGCAAQTLRLRYLGRALNERIVSGTLRLDALQLALSN